MKIALILIALLIVGAVIVVSAQKEEPVEKPRSIEEATTSQAQCGTACNYGCKGRCGVPSCGCS